MAGRYIINQTSGKRVVILDEDNDKVEGGYFNTDGTWVPFGGDDGMVYKGKKFKLKATQTAVVPSAYTVLPFYAKLSNVSRAKASDMFVYATKKLTMNCTYNDMTGVTVVTFVNDGGELNTNGENCVFELPYGIIPEIKDSFDLNFEEVTEE